MVPIAGISAGVALTDRERSAGRREMWRMPDTVSWGANERLDSEASWLQLRGRAKVGCRRKSASTWRSRRVDRLPAASQNTCCAGCSAAAGAGAEREVRRARDATADSSSACCAAGVSGAGGKFVIASCCREVAFRRCPSSWKRAMPM
jgi:hypothetical protein